MGPSWPHVGRPGGPVGPFGDHLGPFFPHSASFSETSHPHAYVYSFVLLRHAEVLLFTLTPTPEGWEYLWPSSLRLRLFQLTVTLTLSPEGGKYLQMSALPVPMLRQVYVKTRVLGFLEAVGRAVLC